MNAAIVLKGLAKSTNGYGIGHGTTPCMVGSYPVRICCAAVCAWPVTGARSVYHELSGLGAAAYTGGAGVARWLATGISDE